MIYSCFERNKNLEYKQKYRQLIERRNMGMLEEGAKLDNSFLEDIYNEG